MATLADKMKDKKSIVQLIGEYEKSVRWNLYRTYRIRNYIVHDAEEKEELTYELLCELHQYVDIITDKIVELINETPGGESVTGAIDYCKLETNIFDEQMKSQKNELVCEENANKYLYHRLT